MYSVHVLYSCVLLSVILGLTGPGRRTEHELHSFMIEIVPNATCAHKLPRFVRETALTSVIFRHICSFASFHRA
jgi:hypothetical protein